MEKSTQSKIKKFYDNEIYKNDTNLSRDKSTKTKNKSTNRSITHKDNRKKSFIKK